MTAENPVRRYGVENYPLIPSRSEFIGKVKESLEYSPVVFVWAPAGNGKTGFGREFRQSTPHTALILAAQLIEDIPLIRQPFNSKIDETTQLTIVDEFALETEEMYKAIQGHLAQDMKFIFLTHHPKNHYLEWQKQHQKRLEPMIKLIHDFPEAPWFYLPKWKPKK